MLRNAIPVAAFAIALGVARVALATDPDAQAASRFLRSAYPRCDLGPVTTFCRVVPERIEPLTNPGLARVLPDTRYFKSRLGTGDYEYPEVLIVLAVTRHRAEYSVEVCPSPFFGDVQEAFLRQYRDFRLPDTAARETFMRGLTGLLAEITPAGSTGSIHCDSESCISELLTTGVLWRYIDMAFDAGGLVLNVRTGNPHGRIP